MAFSGAVKLADLDDFLAPAQNCIKPLIDAEKSKKDPLAKGKRVTIQMEDDATGTFNQISAKQEKASITLSDCLACSGCVTSAETVLITQQSTAEFLSHLAAAGPDQAVVASISPQARTSLATHFGLSPLQMAKRLTTFFKALGVAAVVDTTSSLDISLLEARAEFVARFTAQDRLPLLASECPGWVCYAEKTQGEAVLPFMSAVRSPQQVMGTIVKRFVAARLSKTPGQVYHVSVQPCFDKKLEASRKDFYDQEEDVRDVDCVLSTGELQGLLLERGVDVPNLAESVLDAQNSVSADQSTLLAAADTGGSGGYAEDIFRYTCATVFGVQAPPVLTWKRGRNADMHEVSLEKDGKIVLRVARAYGFRNIQNLMRLIKRKKCVYHYVEVMACPSGCLNGGGQIKADNISAQKQLVQELDATYHQRQFRAPEDNPALSQIYAELAGGEVGSEQAKKVFHTQYKAVEKIEVTNPLAIRW